MDFTFRLNKQIVTSTAVSPFLMRQMYCCVMSQVNIVIQQWKLACNKLCDQGRFIDGQVSQGTNVNLLLH